MRSGRKGPGWVHVSSESDPAGGGVTPSAQRVQMYFRAQCDERSVYQGPRARVASSPILLLWARPGVEPRAEMSSAARERARAGRQADRRRFCVVGNSVTSWAGGVVHPGRGGAFRLRAPWSYRESRRAT